MRAEREIHGLFVCIANGVGDGERFAIETIFCKELKIKRIAAMSFLAGFERECRISRLGGNDGKGAFSGKTVLGEGVRIAIVDKAVRSESADDGEKNGRLSTPESGVALPEIFHSCFNILDARKLGTEGVDGDAQCIVFSGNHT